MTKEINKTFNNREDFDNWAIQQEGKLFRLKIDEHEPEIMLVCVYSKINLVNLSPIAIVKLEEEHLYDTFYCQILPIDWRNLTVIEELDEIDAVKELTGDEKAKLMSDDNLDELFD